MTETSVKTITALCDQIEQAVSAVYTRGCDNVALSNVAQLRGIFNAAEKIKMEIAKKGASESA